MLPSSTSAGRDGKSSKLPELRAKRSLRPLSLARRSSNAFSCSSVNISTLRRTSPLILNLDREEEENDVVLEPDLDPSRVNLVARGPV